MYFVLNESVGVTKIVWVPLKLSPICSEGETVSEKLLAGMGAEPCHLNKNCAGNPEGEIPPSIVITVLGVP